MNRPSKRLIVLAALVAALSLLPVVYLVFRSAQAGPEAWEVFLRPSVWKVFFNSALLAAVTTTGAIALGVPLAWLTTRTDLPLRRLWSVVLILPLAMPSYIAAYAFIALLAHRLDWLYGLPGTAIVITLINYPFVMLTVRAALQRMDPSLEEAAQGLGCPQRQVIWRVTLPHLRPSITSGSLLVALYTLSDFGSPALMQFNAFTRVIYTQYRASFNRNSAALTALLLVVLTIVILMAESRLRGRARFERSSSTAQRKAQPIRLGRWRWAAFAWCSAVASAALLVPIGVIIFWTLRGLRHQQALNLEWEPILNSLLAAALAGGTAVVAAMPIVVLSVRYRGRIISILDRLTYVGNALPGIVIALSLVFFGARHAPWIYQTLPMLVFAYVIRFLPQAVGSIRGNMLQVPPRFEEAARSLGKKRFATFATVTLPMLAPGILAGAALVFLTTIKELPVTLLLSPAGFNTLVMEVWSTASEGLFSQASPPALLIIAVSAFSIGLILRQERRGGLGRS